MRRGRAGVLREGLVCSTHFACRRQLSLQKISVAGPPQVRACVPCPTFCLRSARQVALGCMRRCPMCRLPHPFKRERWIGDQGQPMCACAPACISPHVLRTPRHLPQRSRGAGHTPRPGARRRPLLKLLLHSQPGCPPPPKLGATRVGASAAMVGRAGAADGASMVARGRAVPSPSWGPVSWRHKQRASSSKRALTPGAAGFPNKQRGTCCSGVVWSRVNQRRRPVVGWMDCYKLLLLRPSRCKPHTKENPRKNQEGINCPKHPYASRFRQ